MRRPPLIVVLFLVAANVQPARADIILVDHQPHPYGGGYSDTLFTTSYGQTFWNREGDDFTLTQSATITSIGAWGFYTNNLIPGTETMRIRIHPERSPGGLPDGNKIIYEELFTDPNRLETGRHIIGENWSPLELFYEMTLAVPLTLNAGRYWLEFVQIGDPNTAFRWETSISESNGFAYINPGTLDWRSTLPDGWYGTAFQLWATPEPSSFLLLVVALMLRWRPMLGGDRRRPCKHGVLLFVASLLVAFSPSGARADVILVDHQPHPYGGGFSDTLFTTPFFQPFWQRSADDFTVGSVTTITKVAAWGFYYNDNVPATELMRIRIYPEMGSGEVPNDNKIVYEELLTNPSRVETGRHIIGLDWSPRELFYEATLAEPLLLNAGRYWLEFAQIGDINSTFVWETSISELNGGAYISAATGGTWRSTLPNAPYGVAFQLWTTPEPCGLVLLIFVAFILRSRSRCGGDRRRPCKHGVLLFVASLLVAFSPSDARADVILVDHQPHPYGGGPSDTLYRNNFGQSLWELEADDFTVAAPTMITRVGVWGFYNHDVVPTTETMRIRIYPERSAGGPPDGNEIIYEQLFANPSRTETGRHIIGEDWSPRELFYAITLPMPIALAPGRYWFEFVQEGDINSYFRWETSVSESNGYAFKNPYTIDWQSTALYGTAFQLWAIPEPSSFLLLSTAFVLTRRLTFGGDRRRSCKHSH